MIEYQALNHGMSGAPPDALAAWAVREAPAASDYAWWELAASAASSLVVFALMALAARDDVTEREAQQVAEAYVPVGALHVLLDSFADRQADALSGDHSLVAHYASPADQARQLAAIADQALGRTRALADGDTHALLLAATTSFYVTAPLEKRARCSGGSRERRSVRTRATRPRYRGRSQPC